MAKQLCIGCMRLVPPGEQVCPVCGQRHGVDSGEAYTLRPGTVLNKIYLVGKVIGQGGFGITYIGFDMTLQRKVAIKEYFPMATGMVTRDGRSTVVWSKQVAARNDRQRGFDSFLKEAQKMARLEQIPCVVGVRGVFQQNETAYIVMDFIEGENLKNCMARTGPMEFADCVNLLTPIIRALNRANQVGIIHRDISPDNIMLDRQENIYLLDLGAAKDLNIQQANGAVTSQLVAKHGFSPPEQYMDHGQIGSWTDVYAMCATIYYCVTGKLPPKSTDRSFEDTLAIQPPLTREQFEVLSRGMALRYQNRIQTMDALLKALKSVIPDPEENRRRMEEERRRREESEWRRQEENRRRQEEAEWRRREENRRRQEEAEWRRREENRRRQEEAERLQREEAARRKAEADRRRMEEDLRKAKEERDRAQTEKRRMEEPLKSAQTVTRNTFSEEIIIPEEPKKHYLPAVIAAILVAVCGLMFAFVLRSGEPVQPRAVNVMREVESYDDLDKMGYDEDTMQNAPFWGQKEFTRAEVQHVVFLDTLSGAPGNAFDVSADGSRSILAWMKDGTLYVGSDGGITLNENASYLFCSFTNLKSIDFGSNVDTGKVTHMIAMFWNCSSLTSLNLSGFDTSNVKDMSYMFWECSSLTSLDLSGFDTSKVTNMSGMFGGCERLTSLDLSGFDTSQVTNMYGMFFSCSSLTTLGLSSFDTSNVTNMSFMFFGCSSLTSLNLSSFDTSNVTDMICMFWSCSSLTNLICNDSAIRLQYDWRI